MEHHYGVVIFKKHLASSCYAQIHCCGRKQACTTWAKQNKNKLYWFHTVQFSRVNKENGYVAFTVSLLRVGSFFLRKYTVCGLRFLDCNFAPLVAISNHLVAVFLLYWQQNKKKQIGAHHTRIFFVLIRRSRKRKIPFPPL
eukprot:GEMP01026174.1.p1 GENE.GEMP01026174.1~~GEMP01026174.1.p1  ORF type:complete len:141 (-),score=6.13 GEMP01026174.1:721-1143(-)